MLGKPRRCVANQGAEQREETSSTTTRFSCGTLEFGDELIEGHGFVGGDGQLSSIGFLGEREGKDRSICYDEEMNVSLIMKEKACVLPRSIIVMGAGSVNQPSRI
ncbi:MAG TPA: hypothetical protein VF026_03875 [Ktedonobacteraceae bacterium]